MPFTKHYTGKITTMLGTEEGKISTRTQAIEERKQKKTNTLQTKLKTIVQAQKKRKLEEVASSENESEEESEEEV